MKIVRKHEGELYTPAGHDQTVTSRKIFNPANNLEKADIHMTSFAAGAGMEEEVHDFSDHVFYILSGQLAVYKAKHKIALLEAGDTIHIPAGEAHEVMNPGKQEGVFLAITLPPC